MLKLILGVCGLYYMAFLCTNFQDAIMMAILAGYLFGDGFAEITDDDF